MVERCTAFVCLWNVSSNLQTSVTYSAAVGQTGRHNSIFETIIELPIQIDGDRCAEYKQNRIFSITNIDKVFFASLFTFVSNFFGADRVFLFRAVADNIYLLQFYFAYMEFHIEICASSEPFRFN